MQKFAKSDFERTSIVDKFQLVKQSSSNIKVNGEPDDFEWDFEFENPSEFELVVTPNKASVEGHLERAKWESVHDRVAVGLSWLPDYTFLTNTDIHLSC